VEEVIAMLSGMPYSRNPGHSTNYAASRKTENTNKNSNRASDTFLSPCLTLTLKHFIN
jgi:hypothetical protein